MSPVHFFFLENFEFFQASIFTSILSIFGSPYVVAVSDTGTMKAYPDTAKMRKLSATQWAKVVGHTRVASGSLLTPASGQVEPR